jgi:rSAM/selenodomain-associated transferase 1
MRRALLLFLKFPIPGRVKTRLAADLGPEKAAEAYRSLVGRVLANLSGLEAHLRVLFDPPEAREATIDWIAPQLAPLTLPPDAFLPQIAGDLGDRLTRGFSDAFAAGYSQVAAIGSDCVTLTPAILASAWTALELEDTVLGPTLDGGYYLIGTRSFQPVLFDGIPWSTENTLSAARGAGLTTSVLPELSDVDTLADWLAAQENRPIAPDQESAGIA